MNRLLEWVLASAVLCVPGISCALSASDKEDLRAFAKTQRIEEMWPQIYPGIAVNTSNWVRQFAVQDIGDVADLSPDRRARAKENIEKFMPEVVSDLKSYLQSFDQREMMDFAVSVYGDLLEMPQVRELTAFYKTPLGQKLVAETPAMSREIKAGQKDVLERHFTPAEIKSITAFSQSSAWQRMQAIAPQVKSKMNTYYEHKVEKEVHKLEIEIASKAIASASK